LPGGLHAVIHFWPWLAQAPDCPNFYYFQNAFEGPEWGGNLAVWQQVRGLFKGFLFASAALQQACGQGAVVPFGVDPEVFRPDSVPPEAVPGTCPDWSGVPTFVGNDIRGPEVNARFLEPALPLGLVIFGNGWRGRLADAWKGKLPAGWLNRLYTTSGVNLNNHVGENARYQAVNSRIYEILACEGFCLSDYHDGLADFAPFMQFTAGGFEMELQLAEYLADPRHPCRSTIGERRAWVIANHSYAERARRVLAFLEQIL
jgi:hypothetical protein